MSSLKQTLRSLTETFANGVPEACKHQDAKYLSRGVSLSCVRTMGPPALLVSLGAPADISFTNDQYENAFTREFPVTTLKTCNIHDLLVDVEELKSVVRASYEGALVDGTDVHRDIVYFLDFDAEGKEIVKVHQHMDTEDAREYQRKVEALLAQRGSDEASWKTQ